MIAARQRRPTAVDLFAGAGGFSLGCEQAGFDVIAAVEYDPIHAATHEVNFPRTAVICRDIRSLSGEEVRRRAGIGATPIDLVIGGPPCQGFSLIGKRVLEDERNSLVRHYVRLVLELRPRIFVMENVPGMITGAHTSLVKDVVEAVEAGGYRVRKPWKLLNAGSFGVPQDRTRLFLMGARAGTKIPQYPEPRTRLRPTDGRLVRERQLELLALPLCPSVSDAIHDLPPLEGNAALFHTDVLESRVRGGSRYAKYLCADLRDPADYSYLRHHDRGALTGCRRARHTELSMSRFRGTAPGQVEPVSRFLKLHPNGSCNTLRAGTASDRGAFTAPRPIHYEHPRCVSVREAARLHSFPDWFRFHRTIWHGFRQIGNSVPPMLGRAVAEEALKALGAVPLRPMGALARGDEHLARMTMREASERFGVSSRVIATRTRTAARATTRA